MRKYKKVKDYDNDEIGPICGIFNNIKEFDKWKNDKNTKKKYGKNIVRARYIEHNDKGHKKEKDNDEMGLSQDESSSASDDDIDDDINDGINDDINDDIDDDVDGDNDMKQRTLTKKTRSRRNAAEKKKLSGRKRKREQDDIKGNKKKRPRLSAQSNNETLPPSLD